ncbi:MAG: flagellar M-ring protein FliF C-terminal domain-containing protein [Planctomycetota bacterium]
MDFLNQSFTQLRELFLSMTPAARITAALLLAVVVVSLGYLFTHEIAGPELYLLSGESFSIGELQNMEEAFGQEALDSYEIVGARIRVPRSERNEYMAALAKHEALPEDFGDILDEALAKGSAFMSPSDREAHLKNAKEVQLSRIISSLKEVEAATVMYDTETKPGLRREKVYSASVVVKPLGAQPLDPALASSLRLLVVGSIAGLKPRDVAVTDRNTGQTTFGESGDFTNPTSDPLIARKRFYEQWYTDKILGALRGIPGLTVTPHVELNTEQKHEEEQVKHDAKTVTVQTEESTLTKTVDSTPPAGRVGVVAQANAPTRLTSAAANSSSQDEERSDSSQHSLPSTTVTKSEKAGFGEKRVTVAVTVPTSYFEKVWRSKNPTEEGEEPKQPEPTDLEPIRSETFAKIKETVAAIIHQSEGVTDPTELVTVAEFPDIALPPIPQPGLARNALTWLSQYWSTVGLIGLALFSLVMLRSMIRAVPGGEAEGHAPKSMPTEPGGEEESAQEVSQRKLQRFTGSGASIRDELSELVNEDPETAANILRNWIGTAS